MNIDQLLRDSAPAEREMRQHTERLRAQVLDRLDVRDAVETPRRAGRGRRWWIAVPVAAAIAAGLVVAPSLLAGKTGGPGGASASAAVVLNRAAAYMEAQPQLSQGQYRYVTEVRTYWKGAGTVGERDQGFLMESWVPADRSRPWIQRTTMNGHVTDTTAFADYGPALYWNYPHDSDELLARLYAAALENDSGQRGYAHWVWGEAFRVLIDPGAPDDFKAAVLRALAGLKGVHASAAHTRVGDLIGTALSISRDDQEFVFDSDSGAYLGMVGHIAKPGEDGITQWAIAPETKIVSSAPSPDH